jgi:hypothetical protein
MKDAPLWQAEFGKFIDFACLPNRTPVSVPNSLGQISVSVPIAEPESAEYGACSFELNGILTQFRVAKITPTKVGQFVTVWKRIGPGPIQPYDLADNVNLFIICTRKEDHFGLFIFPKKGLRPHGIVAENGIGGKRGIRVYPPWDKPTSPQAQKTQRWQVEYFVDLSPGTNPNQARQKLHSLLNGSIFGSSDGGALRR